MLTIERDITDAFSIKEKKPASIISSILDDASWISDLESPAHSVLDLTLTFPSSDEKPLTGSPEPPPNGGFQAWLQVAGAFCLYFNSWGLVASYGIFQTIYETGPLSSHSPFEVSIIGSLQTFLMILLCLFVGPVFDAGYFRLINLAGSSLVVGGILMQSFSDSYWQYLISQGAMIGVGASCLCMTAVTIPSMWFSTGLPLANGVAAVGSGLGGVLFPIMIHRLERSIGLHWAIRCVGLIVLTLLAFANAVLRPRGPAAQRRKPRSLIDPSAFTDWPFVLFALGAGLCFLGMYTPFVYVEAYALENRITTPSLAFHLVSIINAASVTGRVLPTLLARRVGSLNLMLLAVAAMSATACSFRSATGLGGLVAATAAYGFWSGTFFAALPTICVRLTNNPAVIGTRMGMAFAALSLPILLGPPVSGAVMGAFGFGVMWLWAGGFLLAGFFTIGAARVVKVGVGLKTI